MTTFNSIEQLEYRIEQVHTQVKALEKTIVLPANDSDRIIKEVITEKHNELARLMFLKGNPPQKIPRNNH